MEISSDFKKKRQWHGTDFQYTLEASSSAVAEMCVYHVKWKLMRLWDLMRQN